MNITTGDNTKAVAKPGRETFTLMAIACLLISNSHLEGFYPQAWMAADGLLGNSIFFLLAGFGVTLSQSRKPYGLARFYSRRISRIYPSLVFVVLVGWTLGLTPPLNSITAAIQSLVWPTGYGFITLVMLLYPVGWAMARVSRRTGAWIVFGCALAWLGGLVATAQTVSPGETVLLGNLPIYMWRLFFTLVFVTGGYFGLAGPEGKPAVLPWFLAVGVAGILYVALKLGYYKGKFEWLSVATVAGCLHGLTLLMVTGLLRLLPAINAALAAVKLERPLAWLGRSSLQVYLCHMWFGRPLKHWEMAWPIKIAVFFLLAIATAVLIRWLIDFLVGYIRARSWRRPSPQPKTS